MSKTHKVTLKPSGSVVEVEEGKNLLQALRDDGDTYIKSSCGGVASCSDCIIKIVSGEDNLTPPPFEELKLLGNVFHITKERLACQTRILGPVTIDISKHNKATDEERMKNKRANFSKKKQVKTQVRKEPDIKKIRQDKEAEQAQFDQEQKDKSDTWKKHWEKDKSTEVKKLAGGKRPKFFDTDKVDYEKNVYTRPLSPEKQKLKNERLQAEREEKELAKVAKDIPDSDKDFKKFRG
jgi:2Fe-2S ferredoxin